MWMKPKQSLINYKLYVTWPRRNKPFSFFGSISSAFWQCSWVAQKSFNFKQHMAWLRYAASISCSRSKAFSSLRAEFQIGINYKMNWYFTKLGSSPLHLTSLLQLPNSSSRRVTILEHLSTLLANFSFHFFFFLFHFFYPVGFFISLSWIAFIFFSISLRHSK